MGSWTVRFTVIVILAGSAWAGWRTTALPEEAKKEEAREKGGEPSHLVAWWKFDETSGVTIADASGQGRHASLLGGLSMEKNAEAGRLGKALRLDGERDKSVTVKGYKGVPGTKPRTVAAWIKTDTPRGEIVSWGQDEGGKMWILGFIRSGIGVTPKGGYLYTLEKVHDNEWHHVAAVVEQADPPNLHDNVKLYKDGQPAEIDDIGLLDLWPIDTGSELDVRIGRGFKGLLDDVRIYDRALSSDEVEALFEGKDPGREGRSE